MSAPGHKGRVLITGASSGVGLAAARLLSRAGYLVAGTARDPEAVKAREKEPLPFTLVAMDLCDPASIDRGWAAAVEILGGVDVLVNNAGSGELGAVEDTDLEASRRLFEVNYFGAVNLVKKAVPGMRERKRGVIIQLGSIVHDLQFPFKANYCASKSALTSFSLSLRYEVHPHGIRVHILEPGWIRSEFHNRLNKVFKPGSVYLDRLKPYLDFTRDQDTRIPDGDAVARVLKEVLENPRAPVRVAVGPEAKKYRLVRRILSNAMLDKLLLWKLAKKGQAL
jgi:NAD(P)-dependent dehydrogenase (short-subunit alcohol dehydrogenase family)